MLEFKLRCENLLLLYMDCLLCVNIYSNAEYLVSLVGMNRLSTCKGLWCVSWQNGTRCKDSV